MLCLRNYLFINLSGKHYPTLAAAKAAGAATINYGIFLNTVLDFVIVALILFLLIRQVNRIKRQAENPTVCTTKECPFCYTKISIKATRCPNCTTELKEVVNNSL
ncbi:MAG: MscL family protein [Desulfocucumaceae bacterium]